MNLKFVNETYEDGKDCGKNIFSIISKIHGKADYFNLSVSDRVLVSQEILNVLSRRDRRDLIKDLIQKLIIDQGNILNFHGAITGQGAQIDTGYIAQHLVSLVTQIPGQAMRGKGLDLIDGSEVKAANFINSRDKKGAVAPRWNFTAQDEESMESFLEYEKIYLLSLDYNPEDDMRIRIWEINPREHSILSERYEEWMDQKGYPKFSKEGVTPSVNFQLFPPKNGTDQNFARHGNGRSNGFPQLEIPLESSGGEKIFEATIEDGETVKISTF